MQKYGRGDVIVHLFHIQTNFKRLWGNCNEFELFVVVFFRSFFNFQSFCFSISIWNCREFNGLFAYAKSNAYVAPRRAILYDNCKKINNNKHAENKNKHTNKTTKN